MVNNYFVVQTTYFSFVIIWINSHLQKLEKLHGAIMISFYGDASGDTREESVRIRAWRNLISLSALTKKIVIL